ncbi:hypothetical protein [Poseidonocella sp. HB161398]|uniref:hypothetical protein n=1 Tax=Poseidonocella sp. HB161398 TaxID=2320855 RepID=UPI0011087977|nr:hypothetical protein [Poseidonocella sp. HB161398]
MTGAEPLWADPAGGAAVICEPAPSAQTLALLAATEWGSGATRYRIPGIAEKLARLRDPAFFVHREDGTDIAVMVLDRCRKRIAGEWVPGFHFVMAATRPDRQGEGIAGRLAELVRAACEAELPGAGFGFAYVEAGTAFSLRISDRIGHALEAEFPLVLFSRLHPRPDPAVRPLAPGEAAEVTARLEALYAGHELTDFPLSLRPQDYLVALRDGRIAAGLQAEVLRWSVTAMPGAAGWLLLRALPRVPVLRRALDLSDLPVLRFGNILAEPGREADVLAVAGTALARAGAKVGLILMDRRSPVLGRLLRHGRRGLLSRAMAGSAVLRLDVAGMAPGQIRRLEAGPLHASAADVF